MRTLLRTSMIGCMALAIVCMTVPFGYTQEVTTPKYPSATVPMIVQSFASKDVRAGDVWKVYLKASDPEGKMRYIFATITQPGVGVYPVSITRIKGENQKELSGYIYLNTGHAVPTNFFNLTLSLAVNIQGKGGVFSQPVFFFLSFTFQPSQEAPLDGVFREQNLGPIMIDLRTVSGRSRED